MRREVTAESLRRRSDAVSWAVTAAHLAVVFGGVAAAAVIGPSPVVLVLWIWTGFALNGLLNLMHECVHRLAFRRRGSSDVLGRWVLGPLVLTDFDGYRERHWAHHRNLGGDDDPKEAYLVSLRGAALVRFVLRCLSGREAADKMAHQALAPAGDDQPSGLGANVTRTLMVQAALLGMLVMVAFVAHEDTADALVSALVAYAGVYLYGLASLTVLAATLRAIAEHQIGDDAAMFDGRAALRNLRAGPLTRLIFGAYGFAEHATHHLEPGVPHYRLQELTAQMADEDPRFAPRRGYLATLWSLRTGRPLESPVSA